MTHKPRILFVDDEAPIRNAFLRWFSMHGFAAEGAQDGLEAVEKCDGGCYDVIAMDIDMPRMNGLDATAAIRARWPGAVVLAISGSPHDPALLLERGAAKVLSKPVSPSDLEREVRALLPAGETDQG